MGEGSSYVFRYSGVVTGTHPPACSKPGRATTMNCTPDIQSTVPLMTCWRSLRQTRLVDGVGLMLTV